MRAGHLRGERTPRRAAPRPRQRTAGSPARRALYVAPLALAITAITLTACSSSGAATSGLTVPSLAGSASGGNGASPSPGGAGQQSGKSDGPPSGHDYSPARATALHNAAACIRAHGIPRYADPVLTPSGATYSDRRPFEDASDAARAAVSHACGTLMVQASLNPEYEPPAPPQLVQAGVASARCMRAHGLPNMRDPSPQTPYTPGHGFGITIDQVPAGGKQDPVFQHAIQACSQPNSAEIRASTLASLGNDG
jgi:hypothetical protein